MLNLSKWRFLKVSCKVDSETISMSTFFSLWPKKVSVAEEGNQDWVIQNSILVLSTQNQRGTVHITFFLPSWCHHPEWAPCLTICCLGATWFLSSWQPPPRVPIPPGLSAEMNQSPQWWNVMPWRWVHRHFLYKSFTTSQGEKTVKARKKQQVSKVWETDMVPVVLVPGYSWDELRTPLLSSHCF